MYDSRNNDEYNQNDNPYNRRYGKYQNTKGYQNDNYDNEYDDGYGNYNDDMNSYQTDGFMMNEYGDNYDSSKYGLQVLDDDENEGFINPFEDDYGTSINEVGAIGLSEDMYNDDMYNRNRGNMGSYKEDLYDNGNSSSYGRNSYNNELNPYDEENINSYDNKGSYGKGNSYGNNVGNNVDSYGKSASPYGNDTSLYNDSVDSYGRDVSSYDNNAYGANDAYANGRNSSSNNYDEYDYPMQKKAQTNQQASDMGMYSNNNMNNDYDDEDYEVTITKPRIRSNILRSIMAILGVTMVGFICGEMVKTIFSDFWKTHISNDGSMILEIAKMIGLVFLAWLCSKIHVFLHTIGHFIGGKISSYDLVSIRVFKWVFVKDGDSLSKKVYDVPGELGECVMMPPEGDGVDYPFLLYKLGGIIMNLVASLLILVVYMKVGIFHTYPMNMVCVIFAIVGGITILYNGVPLIIGGEPNDGYIVVQMLTSEVARKAVHTKLLVCGFLARGGRYTDVPFEQFDVYQGGNKDYTGYLTVKVKMLEYKWYLENMQFANAANCLNSMDSYYKRLPNLCQYEITCEKIFLELIGANSPEKIKKLLDPSLRTYIEDTQKMMSTARLMLTYQACFKNNMKSAKKYYDMIKNNAKSEPLKGEVEFEVMLADYINERFCEGSFE